MNIAKLACLVLVVALVGSLAANASEGAKRVKMNAIKELKDGNKRFVEGKLVHPDQDKARRDEIAASQHPKAIVLSCSDSRVPPEIIFDQGLGDLFVVRVAGNVLNDENLGSIEYAVGYLGVKDIVVLGHSRCGAVTAAVNAHDAEGHVKSVLHAIKPAVEEAKKTCKDSNLVESTAHHNVKLAVKEIRSHFKGVNVVGAYYDLDTGKVEFWD